MSKTRRDFWLVKVREDDLDHFVLYAPPTFAERMFSVTKVREVFDGDVDLYEVESEAIGKLCQELGLDTSCCYDKDDLIRLVKTAFENAKEKND